MTDQQKSAARALEAKLQLLAAHMRRPEPAGGFSRREQSAARVHKLMLLGAGPGATASRASVSEDFVEDQWRAWLPGYTQSSPEWRTYVNNQLRQRVKNGESDEMIRACMGVGEEKIRWVREELRSQK